MFDNKQEPQDIFESVEPPANLPVAGDQPPAATPTPVSPPPAAPVPRPTVPLPPPSRNPQPTQHIVADKDLGTGGHVWKTVVIVIIAFAAMGLAAYLAYRFMTPPDTGTDNPQGNGAIQGDSADNNGVIQDGKGADVEDTPSAPVPIDQGSLDNDGDGLTNDKEATAGTDPDEPDTDQDALGDREEVEVFATDPLNPDSDGDTYKDGVEVGGGYNPNGPGKLYEIPVQEITN
jgi:hypothetical protein